MGLWLIVTNGFASPILAQVPSGASSSEFSVKELSHTLNAQTLEVTLPAPSFDTVRGILSLRPIGGQIEDGDPLAPIVVPIRASSAAIVTILSHRDVTVNASGIQLSRSLTMDVAENGKRGSEVIRAQPIVATHHGIGYAALSYIGQMRAAGISRLEIGILDGGPNSIRAARTIVVKITDPTGISTLPLTDLSEPFLVSNSAFKSRLASANGGGKGMHALSDSDVAQFPGIQADDGSVYRLYVRQDGIYHITFSDLKNFGIDPSIIDPATLRIVNKNQQVAVYVSDNHNDGHFHTDDYFEFYGEQQRYPGPGTHGDFYFDPDTKDNIYFLVLGHARFAGSGRRRDANGRGIRRDSDGKSLSVSSGQFLCRFTG